jgi:hypothetical protein
MKIETVTQTVLRASEGHKLTNGTAYGSSVVLGAGDSPDNWYEITIEEYNEIMAGQEESEVM